MFRRNQYLYGRGVGGSDAAIDGTKPFTHSIDANCDTESVPISATHWFRNEYSAETYPQTGLETEESVGRVHQMLSKD